MISAVRHDASALASERVIATIKLWQAEALDDTNTSSARDARRMLKKLAEALSPEVALEHDAFDVESVTTHPPNDSVVGDDYTQDAVELPPKPKLRRTSRLVTPKRVVPKLDEEETEHKKRKRSLSGVEADDAIVSESASDSGRFRKVNTGVSMPAEGEFNEEDEKPTTALPLPAALNPESSGPKPGPPPLPVEQDRPWDLQDGGPTHHIPIPPDLLAKRAASFARELGLSDSGIGGPLPGAQIPASDLHVDEEATHAIRPEDVPSLIDDLDLEPIDEPLTPMETPAERRHSLAPKPGIIRRSTKSRRLQSSPRPRAAMHHVRALYFVLMPFAGELIPLSYERRSRRFWGRWREVAGDRGVRREFIEDLLRAANDARTLVCELIAEVQTVDIRSVYALVEKMEQSGELEDLNGSPVGTPDRQRGPLVGASVRVEGVRDEDE
jgi:hypothetical protein